MHAAVRDVDAAEAMFGGHERLRAVRRDIRDPARSCALVGDVRPEELYNLAGESSVGASFADPRATWESNAHVVVHLLDAIRLDSPETRFYQASSGEMFGSVPGESVVHDETSALNPQSPYAAAKAAAHLLCRSYRESYGIRIACGILFNHESRRRGPQFLSRKVVDHVHALRAGPARAPARARQPEGAARLGLRARLRRRDDRDPAPGVAARRAGRGGAPTATTCSARGGCTASGSSPTGRSRSPASSSPGARRRRPARVVGARSPTSGEPAVVVDPAFIRPVRPAGDRRRPGPDRRRARLAAAARARRLPRGHARRAGATRPGRAPLSRRGTAARRAAQSASSATSATRAGRGAGRARSRSRAPSRRWSSACTSP